MVDTGILTARSGIALGRQEKTWTSRKRRTTITMTMTLTTWAGVAGGGGEEPSSDDVEPDDVGESDEDDESDESEEDDELEEVSRMPGKESATRIDNISPKLQVYMMI